MSRILRETIRFKSAFTENYTLITDTKIKSGYLDMETKTKIRWALRVIDVAENGDAEIELFTLENLMVDTNNESLNDIIRLNQFFSLMYNELHIIINVNGEVIKIINLQHIKEKWQETKAQLLRIKQQDPALLQLLTINDETFASAGKIKIAIENNEFFKQYFGKIYGNKMSTSRKIIHQNNVLQTAGAEWIFNFNHRPRLSIEYLENIIIRYDGEGSTHKTDWKKLAYGHLPDINTRALDPKLHEKGSYRCNFKTGKLDYATTELTEIALTDIIDASIKYTIEGDGYKNNVNNIQKQSYADSYRIID